ncbi:hypothetical protein BH09PAT1_BH09PAT1_1480 [soil metagenome]
MDKITPKKVLTANRAIVTLIIFGGVGLLANSVFTYTQSTITQNSFEERAIAGEELKKLNQQQIDQLNILLERVSNVETKLEKLEKTGKAIK